MIIYLTHPKNGVMVVYSNDEAIRHEEMGWTKHSTSDEAHAYMKGVRKAPVTEVQFTPEPTVIDVSRETIKRKPGRPKKV